MEGAPPWGTHPADNEAATKEAGSWRARLLRFGVAVTGGLICTVVVVLALTADQDNPVLDVAVGLVMLVLVVAAVAGLGYVFWWTTVRGFVWWGRVLSPALLVVSAWAVALANSYGDAHHLPDGTVTGLAGLLLLPPVIGVIGALIGVGMTWVWSFTPAGRAAMWKSEGLDQVLPPSGWPPDDAEPPFAFRVPHHEAWHQLVLPMSIIVFALLGLVSVLVHDPDPVLVAAAFVVLMSPFVIPLILQAYRRRMVVRPDGLYVARTLTARLIAWPDLADIEIALDRGSQNNESRIWLLTTRGRFATDVPKAEASLLEYWRDAILAARPRLDPTQSHHAQEPPAPGTSFS